MAGVPLPAGSDEVGPRGDASLQPPANGGDTGIPGGAQVRSLNTRAMPARYENAQATSLRAVGADDEYIVLSKVSKVYEPTPGWMRPFARTHIREPVQALDSVDLVVRAGEICAVIGPNGAGKTSLFRIIVGLTTASSGSGHLLGLDVEHDQEEIRQVVGWMPAEDRSLLMRATSKENLYLHGRLQGLRKTELNRRISEILDVVGLSNQGDSIVASLSSGMKARLRLARALLPHPRILLLDEPTGAIDPIAAHSLLGLITDLTRDQGLAVLLSSHRLEEIEALHAYALLLDGGRVKFAGDLDHLREAWDVPALEITFSDSVIAERVGARLASHGIHAEVDGAVVHCLPSGRLEIGTLLADMDKKDRGEVRRIREIPLPLRDLIAQIYSGDPADAREPDEGSTS